jgi:hypothetical protein
METRPPSNLDFIFSNIDEIERLIDCFKVMSILYNCTFDGNYNSEGNPDPSA